MVPEAGDFLLAGTQVQFRNDLSKLLDCNRVQVLVVALKVLNFPQVGGLHHRYTRAA